jgi:Ca2+-binding EF-hand superfamily protein
MDPTQAIGSTSGTSTTQAVHGHHRHHKSMADMVKDMSSAIDDAQKAGKLTNDQAASMKKELDDITKMLSQNQTGSTSQSASTNQANSTSQTGSVSQLSADDRKKIRSEMHDVEKQLFAALNPQQSTATAANPTDQVNNLFKAMDSNGDGTIDKNELTSSNTHRAQNGQNGSDPFSSGYNQQGSQVSASVFMSQINISA